MEKIQLTKGCPNGCQYCHEPKKMEYLDMPIFNDQRIQILDMNFLANLNHMDHIDTLGTNHCKTELVCGIDYRILTQEIANALHDNGFIRMRWAWDYSFNYQKKHRNVFLMLRKAGYKPKELSVFMIVNWKIPYYECCQKLDLLKVWNVKVNDCCWDGGYKIAKPKYWDIDDIKRFRKMCRKHNQIVNFGIDPEY